jgi:hypothetical protein
MSDDLSLIGELLMDDNYMVRLSAGTRWMVFYNPDNEWVVYEHKLYQKKVRKLYEGSDLKMALSFMKE